MSLLLHVIVTYIKENMITKLQKYTACPETLGRVINCLRYLWKIFFVLVIYHPHAKYSWKGLKLPARPPTPSNFEELPPLSPPPPMFSTPVPNPALGFNSSTFVYSCFPPKFQFLYCLLSSLSLQGAPMVGTERKIFKI